jgi:hypothetical protein
MNRENLPKRANAREEMELKVHRALPDVSDCQARRATSLALEVEKNSFASGVSYAAERAQKKHDEELAVHTRQIAELAKYMAGNTEAEARVDRQMKDLQDQVAQRGAAHAAELESASQQHQAVVLELRKELGFYVQMATETRSQLDALGRRVYTVETHIVVIVSREMLTATKSKLGTLADETPRLKERVKACPSWRCRGLFNEDGTFSGHALLVFQLPPWLKRLVDDICRREFEMTREELRELEFLVRGWSNATIHELSYKLFLLRDIEGGVTAHLRWMGFSELLVALLREEHAMGAQCLPCPRDPTHAMSLPRLDQFGSWCSGCCGCVL